jgi:hypothetical protein
MLFMLLLWHIDRLLGKDREISKDMTAVTKYWFRKQVYFHATVGYNNNGKRFYLRRTSLDEARNDCAGEDQQRFNQATD